MDELPFDAYGLGVTHMALADPDEPCPRCHGRQFIGPEELPLPCPACYEPEPVEVEDGDG